jgi:hypothetical protein
MQYLYLRGIVFTSSRASEAFYQNQLPFLVLRTPAKSRPPRRCGCYLRLIITTVQCFRAVIVRDIVSNYPLPKPKLDFMRTMKELEKYVLLHQDLSLRATPRFIGDAVNNGHSPQNRNIPSCYYHSYPHAPTIRSQNIALRASSNLRLTRIV